MHGNLKAAVSMHHFRLRYGQPVSSPLPDPGTRRPRAIGMASCDHRTNDSATVKAGAAGNWLVEREMFPCGEPLLSVSLEPVTMSIGSVERCQRNLRHRGQTHVARGDSGGDKTVNWWTRYCAPFRSYGIRSRMRQDGVARLSGRQRRSVEADAWLGRTRFGPLKQLTIAKAAPRDHADRPTLR